MKNQVRAQRSLALSAVTFGAFAALGAAADERPPEEEMLQPGVSLTLVAEHPNIATPTGVDVDADGKVWAVACHTHMPPDDYPGPEFDQVLVFDPSAAGDDREPRVFYQATHHTMDLELGADGWVYLAERDRILRIRDTDGDGRADVEEELATLASEADYPHNGLSALAWHPEGDLCFGLGENFSQQWTLTANDGTTATGFGEGGIFSMGPDGTGLHRVARGLWNPFGLTVRADGEMFAAENDPGERPPCRLLHIVEGGDYGYQRAYGPEAHHPFVCWNGELRGTLPMIHPSGEGPCGVAVLGNGLIVPSWSDHRIDFFALKEWGASFTAERIALVNGSRYFRPVCIAEDKRHTSDPVRVWYLTDWVDGRYQVHGYGRLWRLEIDLKKAASWVGEMDLAPRSDASKTAALVRENAGDVFDEVELFELARSEDPFIARAALMELSRRSTGWKVEGGKRADEAMAVLALKLAGSVELAAEWLPHFLASENPEVVFESLRWIADARLEDFADEVDALLGRNDLEFRLFEAAMAAKNTLAGKPEAGVRDEETLMSRLLDPKTSPRLRAYALRLAVARPRSSPKKAGELPALRYPRGLTVEVLAAMLDVGDETLSLEVVRTLAGYPVLAQQALAEVAGNQEYPPKLRAEAIVGLAALVESHQELLASLAEDPASEVRDEAVRALRQQPPGDAQRPALTDTAGWLKRLDAVEEAVDIESGRRLFHHPRLGLCANCHRHSGRGSVVGPDLSRVGDRGDRAWLLESILNPNAEIAPEYLPRTVTLKDGTIFTGIRLRSSTAEAMRDTNGQNVSFKRDDIASMEELQMSFMPTGLPMSLTDRELRDLLAFLESEGRQSVE